MEQRQADTVSWAETKAHEAPSGARATVRPVVWRQANGCSDVVNFRKLAANATCLVNQRWTLGRLVFCRISGPLDTLFRLTGLIWRVLAHDFSLLSKDSSNEMSLLQNVPHGVQASSPEKIPRLLQNQSDDQTVCIGLTGALVRYRPVSTVNVGTSRCTSVWKGT